MKRLAFFALALLVPVFAFSQRLPRTVFPVHYDITLTPHLADETFEGKESIAVSVQQPTREITLNALEIEFKSVTIESKSSPGADSPSTQSQNGEVKLDPEKEMAILTFPRPVQPGPATIRIEFSGKLNRDLRGFYVGDSPAGKYAASQGEATDIRRAFPAFDEPAMKATFGIAMIVDKGDTAISNTAVASDTPGPGPNQHTIRFATTPRLSSYLVALLAGDYHCSKGEVDQVPLGICTIGDRSALTGFALDETKGILGYYDNYYSIHYPFDKLDQIGIPDFAAGAMENAGAIVYRESALLSDPKTASIDRRKGIASTIAHEIAHMWFGDLVTMRWWNDIWLNEGFATWMTTKPLKKLHPEWHFDLEDANETANSMNTDILSSTRPIRANAETSRDIDTLFDSIAYGKTASLLRMVESYTGEENFRSGINAYLLIHAFDNSESFDFFEALASASHVPADEVMNSFVNQGGLPVLEVQESCEGAETVLHIRQSRFFEDPHHKSENPQRWTVPICPAAGDQTCQLLREEEQTFRVKNCNAPEFLNRNGTGYFITEYQPDTETLLLQRINTFQETERMAFARDEWFLVNAGTRPVGTYLQIARAAQEDRTPEFMESLYRNLQYIDDHWTSSADGPAYRSWVSTILQPALRDLGMAAVPGDPEERRLARAYIWKALAVTAKDSNTADAVHEMAEKYLKDHASLDPDAITSVLEAAAALGDAHFQDEIVAAYEADGTPEEKRTFLFSLAAFRDPALLQRTMEFALTSHVRKQDKARLMAAVLRNPMGTTTGWNFYKQRWGDIGKSFSDAMLPALVGSTSSICDEALRDEVKQFFAAHPVAGADRSLSQALEKMSICISNKSIQQKNLSQWLDANMQRQ